MPPNDPLLKVARPLAAALISVVFSILIAALIGGAMPLDYDGRAWVYTGCVVYAVTGAVVIFRATVNAESAPLSPAYLAKWLISVWAWPALLFGRRRS